MFGVLVHLQFLWIVRYIYEGFNGTVVDLFKYIHAMLPANGYTSKLVPIQTNWSENSQSNSASSKNLKMRYYKSSSFNCVNKPSRECFAKEDNVRLQPATTRRTNWVPVQHNLFLDVFYVGLLLTVGTSCRCKGTMGLNDLVLGQSCLQLQSINVLGVDSAQFALVL